MIRQSGVEPTIIEYLKTPPTRERLVGLIKAMGTPVRALLRDKGTPFRELGLDEQKWSDDDLIDQMLSASHSHQPSDRRDAQGAAIVPPIGEGLGAAA
jgi:arsenate reductase-like glutaredoxin family protein